MLSVSVSGILSLYTEDKFLKNKIDFYLNKTSMGEIIPDTFNDFVLNTFVNLSKNELIEAFKLHNKDKIDNTRWASSTNELIVARDVLTFDNVGSVYYKNFASDFIRDNKSILIKDFITKYCKEKEIREEFMNVMLITENLETKVIGQLLSKALQDEYKKREEDTLSAEVLAEVNSRECVTYQLPNPPVNCKYQMRINGGNGYVDHITNLLTFYPPTVVSLTKIPFDLLVLNQDGIIVTRKPMVFNVKPVKYTAPAFKTYKVLQNTSISITLDHVIGNYKYVATVPKGFGTVEVKLDKLTYTAPVSALDQNVAVKLQLIWNDDTTVYETVINFRVVLDPELADVSEDNAAIESLSTRLNTAENKITELDANIKVVDKSVTIQNSDILDS